MTDPVIAAKSQEGLKSFADFIETIPVVGKFLAVFFRASPSVRETLMLLLILGALYPIFAFGVVITGIYLLPSQAKAPIQKLIRKVIDMPAAINASNGSIDSEVPMTFSIVDGLPSREAYFEKFTLGQQLSFSTYQRFEPKLSKESACVTVPGWNDTGTLGKILITVPGTDIQQHFDVPVAQMEAKEFGEDIDDAVWKEVKKRKMDSHVNLAFRFLPNDTFTSKIFGDCGSIFANITLKYLKSPIS